MDADREGKGGREGEGEGEGGEVLIRALRSCMVEILWEIETQVTTVSTNIDIFLSVYWARIYGLLVFVRACKSRSVLVGQI